MPAPPQPIDWSTAVIASILSDPSSLGVLIGFIFIAAVAIIGWGFAHIGHDGQ